MLRHVLLLGTTLMSFAVADVATAATLNGQPPIVIGHRGASGYRPEHTLASYRFAIQLGANYIEPDLVSTRDGVLIARHEPNITGTTDVSTRPEFASRFQASRLVDGRVESGWFADDFTLAEIKTLRAVERLPALRTESASYNGQFEVPTLQEVIDLARQETLATGRTVGIYPETKHPTYFQDLGLPLEQRLVDTLNANGLTGPTAPVFIQSFEVANLQQLNGLTDVPLVQLFDDPGVQPFDFVRAGNPGTFGDLATAAGLLDIAGYADGVGPFKRYIVPQASGVDGNGDGTISNDETTLGASTRFVDDAHAAGLLVHPYTFRSEGTFLATNYNGDPVAEYLQFYALGVDGVFSDNPDVAVRALALQGGGTAVPEPATLGVLAMGMAGMLGLRRRKPRG